MRRILTMSLLFLAFGLLPSLADASVIFTYDDTTAYTSGDVVGVTPGSVDTDLFIRETRAGLQTFTVDSSENLQAVNILIRRLGPSAVIDFALLDFGTTDPNGSSITQTQISNASVLDSFEYTAPATTAFGDAPDWEDAQSALTWTLSSVTGLSADHYYGLQIVGRSDTSPQSMVWQRDIDNGYAGGRAYGISDSDTDTTDYGTALFGTGGSGAQGNDWTLSLTYAPIPEPTSLALLAAGAVLVGLRRRRRAV